jgi:hypothetical protein
MDFYFEKKKRNVKVKDAGANYDDVFVRSNRIYIIDTRAHTYDRTSQQDHVPLFLIFYVYIYKDKLVPFLFQTEKNKIVTFYCK